MNNGERSWCMGCGGYCGFSYDHQFMQSIVYGMMVGIIYYAFLNVWDFLAKGLSK